MPIGGFTTGQLQVGAVVLPVCWQPLASVTVKLVVVLVAILSNRKAPPPMFCTVTLGSVATKVYPPAPPLRAISALYVNKSTLQAALFWAIWIADNSFSTTAILVLAQPDAVSIISA